MKRNAGGNLLPINTSNYLVATIYQYVADIKQYFFLVRANQALVQENAALRQQLFNHSFTIDALTNQTKMIEWKQTNQLPYQVVPAKVVNNSLVYTRNYITINKGARHGILPGMGVMMGDGIVGKVREVSDHYSTVVSLLHVDLIISAKIASNNTLGSVSWQGGDPTKIHLLYVPRYVAVQKGDAIVTSGFGSIFPENLPIGTVSEVQTKGSDLFHQITLKVKTPFHALQYVYVMKDFLSQEKKELEQSTQRFYD